MKKKIMIIKMEINYKIKMKKAKEENSLLTNFPEKVIRLIIIKKK